jgi:hypothetical protein
MTDLGTIREDLIESDNGTLTSRVLAPFLALAHRECKRLGPGLAPINPGFGTTLTSSGEDAKDALGIPRASRWQARSGRTLSVALNRPVAPQAGAPCVLAAWCCAAEVAASPRAGRAEGPQGNRSTSSTTGNTGSVKGRTAPGSRIPSSQPVTTSSSRNQELRPARDSDRYRRSAQQMTWPQITPETTSMSFAHQTQAPPQTKTDSGHKAIDSSLAFGRPAADQ